MRYRSAAAAFEGAVGVGFDVRRAHCMKSGGVEQDRWYEVPHDDPALVTAPTGVPVGATGAS